MTDLKTSPLDKYRVHFKDLPFKADIRQIIYYDPNPESEFSDFVEANLQEIKSSFEEIGFEFCYFPAFFSQMTNEQIHYIFPNWKGEPLPRVGNDLLKPYLALEDRDSDICACFLHLFDMRDGTFSCYQLRDFSTKKWEDQFACYKRGLLNSLEYDKNENSIRFSIVSEEKGKYQRKIVFDIEDDFEKETEKVMFELLDFLKNVQVDGIRKFVIDCSVPIESRLSRLVVDENYNIILPDYGNMIIELGPMPKAVYLLFLRHEEGINFKDLVDYREELRIIYEKITNRKSTGVIDESIGNVTNPMRNTLNEKCSRIREAFLLQMDETLAHSYCVTGNRGEAKRITLPRNLVEWRCKP